MQVQSTQSDTATNACRLRLSIARTREELREVQALRYRIFFESAGLAAPDDSDGLDSDEFDEYCDHLIVRDSRTLQVVGTYRVLNPREARRLGRLYSEGEFDLGRLGNLRSRMVEAGRACIHPAYRSGAVIMLLWAGLADYMRRESCEYLAGCASISLANGRGNAQAIYHALSQTNLSPQEYRVTPHLPLPVDTMEVAHRMEIPALLKGYMRSGAWICGAPAWDPDFNCADLFLLLPLNNLDERYARRYLQNR